MVPQKPQDDTIKGDATNSEKHSATMNYSKNPLKNSIRIQKERKKMRKIPVDILKQPLENTLEFKRIQTLQVLEV